jgi:hypothetical protein
MVVSPMEFRDQVDPNVRELDFYGSRKKIDPNTGEEMVGGDGSHMFHGVVGIVWSDELVTLTRAAGHNGVEEESIMSSVAGMMSLVPEGRMLELHTESEWLAAEMEKMRGHAAVDFSGDLSWDEVPAQWKRVLEYVSNGSQVRGIHVASRERRGGTKGIFGTTTLRGKASTGVFGSFTDQSVIGN